MDDDARNDGTTAAFFGRLEALVTQLAELSDRDDAAPQFAGEAIAAISAIGGLSAPLPESHGGLGLGCATQGSETARFLRLLGQGGIAIGRLIEGHVNALRLVWLYGDDAQRDAAAADARAGLLFGVWVTEAGSALRVVSHAEGPVLAGGKGFCSGAGHVARALVTAADADGSTRMLLVALDFGTAGSARIGTARSLQGVRAAMTADMTLSGLAAGRDRLIGAADDYLRAPEFAAGAWRGSAVALGGLDALVALARAQLVARGRHANPHQAARIGRMLIACETARMWVERAANIADRAGRIADADVANTVNLARIAVETACLDAIIDVQRALGLGGFVRGNRVERLLRDLATYLRQPAPDETLTEAAIWFADRALPDDRR